MRINQTKPILNLSICVICEICGFIILQNKPNSTFLNPCIHASLYSCISPNEPNFFRRAYVELHYLVRPHGIEPGCVRPNEPNFKKNTQNVYISGSKCPSRRIC